MIDLPEPYYRAIGKITHYSAELDFAVADILRTLVHTDRADLLIAGQSFAQLSQGVRAYSKKYLDPGMQTTLRDLLQRAAELHQERDTIVHGSWLPSDVEAYVAGRDADEHYVLRSRRWKPGYSGRKLGLNEIETLATDLAGLTASMREFGSKWLPHALSDQSGLAACVLHDDPDGRAVPRGRDRPATGWAWAQ